MCRFYRLGGSASAGSIPEVVFAQRELRIAMTSLDSHFRRPGDLPSAHAGRQQRLHDLFWADQFVSDHAVGAVAARARCRASWTRCRCRRYSIEPPDILMINAIKVVPKPPHKIEPFDGLLIRVLGTLPDQTDRRRVRRRSGRHGRPRSVVRPRESRRTDDRRSAVGHSAALVASAASAAGLGVAGVLPRVPSRFRASTWWARTAASTWERTVRCT